MRTEPLLVFIGVCASILWLKRCGTGIARRDFIIVQWSGTGAGKI